MGDYAPITVNYLEVEGNIKTKSDEGGDAGVRRDDVGRLLS